MNSHYAIAGVLFRSEFTLSTAAVDTPAHDEVSSEALVEIVSGILPDTPQRNVTTYYSNGTTPWLLLERVEGGTLARILGLAGFYYDSATRTLRVEPSPESDPAVVAHYVYAFGVPFVLACQGTLVFHGSAVADEDRAILFVGASGAGKSTAAFTAVRKGWRLLADDFVVVRRASTQWDGSEFQTWGASSSVRLRDDMIRRAHVNAEQVLGSVVNKSLVELPSAANRGHRLSKVVFLVPEENATDVRRDSNPQSAFQRLLRQLFFGFSLKLANHDEQFAAVADIIAHIPYEFVRTYDSAVVETLLSD